MKKKILIIGSLNMDMNIEMDRIPAIGETVLGKTVTYVPGGKGANQAYAAGKLGGEVKLLGCVGADKIGEALVDNVSKSGVDISHVERVEGVPTGMATIFVDKRGNNCIVVTSGANEACTLDFLKKKDSLLEECDLIMIQMEIPYESVLYSIRRANQLGKEIILNPAPAPESLPDDIWKKIDYLTPNETEILKLSGNNGLSIEKVEDGANKLVNKGVKNVLVTLGDKGVLYKNARNEIIFPARNVSAIDTVACGDCFNGAFAVGLSEGMDVNEAITFANLSASIAVTRRGAQSSMPSRREVNEILEVVRCRV